MNVFGKSEENFISPLQPTLKMFSGRVVLLIQMLIHEFQWQRPNILNKYNLHR